MNKYKKKKAIFVISNPNMFAYFLIIAKKYQDLIAIINISKQHSYKTKDENIKIIKEYFPSTKIYNYTYKYCWSTQRFLAIKEGKIYLQNLKQEIEFSEYDIYCNPRTSPTSLLLANQNIIFWIFHGEIEILLNIFFPFLNLYNLLKYKLRIKGIRRILGFVRINNLSSMLLNYQSVWDFYINRNPISGNIAVFLWPESQIWNQVTEEQTKLAKMMIKEFYGKIKDIESIFVKFHPRQYSLINDKEKQYAIDVISNHSKYVKNIREIKSDFDAEALTLEMIYILQCPKKIYSIDMGSSAAWNLSPLANSFTYTFKFNKNNYYHNALPYLTKLARFIFELIALEKPIYLDLKSKKVN